MKGSHHIFTHPTFPGHGCVPHPRKNLAIGLWIETVLDDGGTVPMPGKIETHRANPEFTGWTWALVEVDPTLLSDKAERVNITLPARLLRRIDTYAGAHHENRSGFLARAAMGAMQTGE